MVDWRTTSRGQTTLPVLMRAALPFWNSLRRRPRDFALFQPSPPGAGADSGHAGEYPGEVTLISKNTVYGLAASVWTRDGGDTPQCTCFCHGRKHSSVTLELAELGPLS